MQGLVAFVALLTLSLLALREQFEVSESMPAEHSCIFLGSFVLSCRHSAFK